MKESLLCLAILFIIFTSCNNGSDKNNNSPIMNTIDSIQFKSGYSDVNGIKMYYEVYGQGEPSVLIHGGGSTIQSSFERIIPKLANHFKLLAVELQNHGRTGFRTVPQTFEQDADDVAALLRDLGIDRASFFGFSNGATTAMQIAIRHPTLVNKLVLAAAAYKRNGLIPGFFDGMQQATLENMPKELKTSFLAVNPDSSKLQAMFEKDRNRMIAFRDISDEQVKSIKAPTLVINGDADVITVEHTVEIYRMIPGSRLAIIPGSHGEYIGEVTTRSDGSRKIDFLASMIREFMSAPHK